MVFSGRKLDAHSAKVLLESVELRSAGDRHNPWLLRQHLAGEETLA
jgi:hypothetical protein